VPRKAVLLDMWKGVHGLGLSHEVWHSGYQLGRLVGETSARVLDVRVRKAHFRKG